MTKGRIKIVAENAKWTLIQNAAQGSGIKGSHEATAKFLLSLNKLLSRVRFGRGDAELALQNERVLGFIQYCNKHGFEVVGA